MFYRPEEPQYYYYYLEEHPDIYWVHFSCKENHELLQKYGWGKEKIYYVGEHNSYIQLFDAMIQELQFKQPFYEEQLQLLMQQLLLKMGRNQI